MLDYIKGLLLLCALQLQTLSAPVVARVSSWVRVQLQRPRIRSVLKTRVLVIQNGILVYKLPDDPEGDASSR